MKIAVRRYVIQLAALFLFLQGFNVALAQSCTAPSAPSITFAPPGVGVGQTYAITWRVPSDLDSTGGYIVERSKDSSFGTITDSQRVTSNYASFLATSEATFYHRVRAFNGCDPTKVSSNSAAASVGSHFGNPSVVFTVQPQPVITTLNDPISNYKTSFKVENLSPADVTVNIFPAGPSFFKVVNLDGSDVLQVTLPPKTPQTFNITFFGANPNVELAYQGVVALMCAGCPPKQGLAITPYAFVNLKIGGNDTVTPVFMKDGKPIEYLFFPGFSSALDDSSRPPVSIGIQNPGSSAMQLAAEIGPEVWLLPAAGWNSSPIAASQTSTVSLQTVRNRAPTGSALPRYTYFTVRSKNGQSARLLVQDNDAASLSAARSGALSSDVRTYIVPYVVSDSFKGSDVYSRVRISNVGGQRLNAELFFTPNGVSGFDTTAVLHATVVVPPNDVVSLTDPLQQIFGLHAPVSGQLEVRTGTADADKIGLLTVTSTVLTPATGGGYYSYDVPVATRGEGAKVGAPQTIVGLTSNGFIQSDLVLAETAGIAGASSVRVTIFDKDGVNRGNRSLSLSPYGEIEIKDVLVAISGTTLEAARTEIEVQSGNGQVIGIAKVLNMDTNAGATLVSQPTDAALLSRIIRASAQRVRWGAQTATTAKFVIPGVVHGPISTSQTASYQTNLGLAAPVSASATFTVTFINPAGTRIVKTVPVDANKTSEIKDVLNALFNIYGNAQGTITVEGPIGSRAYARLDGVSSSSNALAAAIPVVPTTSDALVSASTLEQRPIYFDGLEQSTDSTRGTRWIVFVSEISGQAVSFRVLLYEAGNRTLPIAEKAFTLAAYQQLELDSIFSAMGLDSDSRRKDRTNVLMVITPESGSGVLAATAVAIDNRSKGAQSFVLTPTGGVSPTGLAGRITPPPPSPRRRPVRPR
jgi:hypothetical protein